MTDRFYGMIDNTVAPARAPFAVVPDDAGALASVPKGLYVGGGGDLVLRGVDAAADVTFANLQDGQILPVRALYVRATGTTATNIVGLV